VTARVDVIGLLIAVAGALAIGACAAGIGYLLGAPAKVLGALTEAVVGLSVVTIFVARQRRRTGAAVSAEPAPPPE
jgi:uncharacterized MnhB-related membrane protein